MLGKVNTQAIQASTQTIQISAEVNIFVKTLNGPQRSSRTAIYIHGGGGGGNHTLIERPSRHMINDGFFDRIILPDKRGDGGSSPLNHVVSIREHAEDMCALLDKMGVTSPITAMGVSYGGPIALDLAAIDSRIERVVLIASSPALKENNGIGRFLLKSGILKPMMRSLYKTYLGKLPPAYVDFDSAYDAKKSTDLVKMFTEALKRTPKSHMESMIFALEGTLNEANACLDESVRLNIPVLQVVGAKDEVWGSKLLPEYLDRFPRFRQYLVPEGRIHKDVFLKPDAFQRILNKALSEEFFLNEI